MSGVGNYCHTDSAVPQSAAGPGPRSSTALGKWRGWGPWGGGGGGIPLGGGGGGGGPGHESIYICVYIYIYTLIYLLVYFYSVESFQVLQHCDFGF